MDRQIINFSANEQSLIKTSGLDHYAGNVVRYIEAHFDLGANWSGYDSVRAIWRNKRDVTRYSTVLNSEGVCVVPYEVLTLRGDVCMNLVGSIVESGVLVDRITTYPICALTVDVPAMVDGSDPASITPSEYEQFVAKVANDANRAEAGAESAEASAQSASGSAEQATLSAQASEASALRASGYASDAQASERNASEYAQNASESATSAENAKEDAESARDKILSMRATAETLAEGSQATASYSDGLLTLGIPRGDTGARGEKGEKGETGETGATPNLSIGTVETLEPTESATASITGTAENPVLNLGLPQGKTGEVSYEDLSSLLPKDTASGDIISIPDGQSIIPVESLKVTLEPIQSGTGTPSPDNIRPISGWTDVDTQRTGKNLLPPTLPSNIIAGDFRDNGIVSAANARVFAIPVPKNTDLVIQKEINDRLGANVALCDTGDIAVGTMVYNILGLTNVVTQTLNTGDHEWMVIKASTLEGAETFWTTRELMISVGTTRQDYVAPSEDGTTYTTDLGQTVYGGTLDVVSGELVVDRAIVNLGTLSASKLSYTNKAVFICLLSGYKKRTTASETDNAVCSMYVAQATATAASLNNGYFFLDNSRDRMYVRNDDFIDASGDDFKSAMNGVQLCYELATPQTIQLDPQEIKLLVGDNTIWSDGQVTMVYSADVARWVMKKLNQ